MCSVWLRECTLAFLDDNYFNPTSRQFTSPSSRSNYLVIRHTSFSVGLGVLMFGYIFSGPQKKLSLGVWRLALKRSSKDCLWFLRLGWSSPEQKTIKPAKKVHAQGTSLKVWNEIVLTWKQYMSYYSRPGVQFHTTKSKPKVALRGGLNYIYLFIIAFTLWTYSIC